MTTRSQRGQECTFNTAVQGARLVHVVLSDEAREQAFTLLVQAKQLVNCTATATLSYGVAGSLFTRSIPITTALQRIPLCANSLWLDVTVTPDNTSDPLVAVIAAGAGDGMVDGPDDWWPSWKLGSTLAQSSTVTTGPGVVLAGCGYIASLGAASQVWLMLFDATVAPTNGTAPIAPAIGPLVANQQWAFSDESMSALPFVAGLYWGLSSTGDTYTAAVGATARADWKVGT